MPAMTQNVSETIGTHRYMQILRIQKIPLRELLGWRDAEAFGPRDQRRQDVLMKLHALANLTPASRERSFSRKPNRRVARRDRRVVTYRDEVMHLARERLAPAERIRIDQLQEHGRRP